MNRLPIEVEAPPPERPIQPGEIPSFSVLIAAYDAADTIADAVTSALGQTVAAHEVMVFDDGSSDELESSLRPFGDRVTLLRAAHRGAAAARNDLLRKASGEFVVFLDTDDVFLPRRLEAMGELSAARPDLDLLATDAYFELEGRTVGRFYEENSFSVHNQRVAILRSCFVGWPAARRRRLLKLGGFDETLPAASDWDAWMRMILDGALAGAVREPLLRYRIRAGSLSSDRVRSLHARVAILDKRLREFDLGTEERTAAAAARRRTHERLLVARARKSLVDGAPHARRHALRLSAARELGLKTRLLALGGALSPSLGARILRSGRPRDERAPWRQE